MTNAVKTPARGRKKIDQAALDAANEASKALSEKQQQAASKPRAKAAPKTRAKAATGLGKQRQADAAAPVMEKQGASASGKSAPVEELRGGTKQVLITEAVMVGRSGRPAGVEEYPFGELPPAYKDENGQIVGLSFFIPMTDKAEGKLSAARKRHKCLFWSRTVYEQVNGKGPKVEGLRIWRGTPDIKA